MVLYSMMQSELSIPLQNYAPRWRICTGKAQLVVDNDIPAIVLLQFSQFIAR